MAGIEIRVEGERQSVSPGTTVGELFRRCYPGEADILGAVFNNHVVSLNTTIQGEASVRPVRRAERDGDIILRRSGTHLFHAVIAADYPHLRVVVGQSILGGYYYEVIHAQGKTVDLETLAHDVTEKLQKLAKKNVPLVMQQVSVDEAESVLSDPFGHKATLLRAWAAPTVAIVSLDGFTDIQHGPYVVSTGSIQGLKVVSYPPGLVLQFQEPPEHQKVTHAQKLYATYRETREWNERVGVATVGDLNEAILDGRIDEVAHIAEGLHEKKIVAIADMIVARCHESPLICVAGPSSSGKTTFVRRLSVQLRVNGVTPISLGLDDYYKAREEAPRDEDGKLDFEALEALNLDLLHENLVGLLAGKKVNIPHFDFISGKPTDQATWRSCQVKPGQVLLIEGIHGLNPRLTGPVPDAAKFRIFVSALTQLVIDEHNRIYTSDSRLLRRIVRDRRYRGTSTVDTIERWPSVRRGEDRHIFPYQELSEVMFNSALVYETPVLRTFALRYLLEVPREHPARAQAYQLLKFLELFVPVFPDLVPANSILREFVGGSGFAY